MHRNTDMAPAKYRAMVSTYIYNLSKELKMRISAIPKHYLERVGARLVGRGVNGWALEINEPRGDAREEAIAHMAGWGVTPSVSASGRAARRGEGRPPGRRIGELEPLAESHEDYELGLDPRLCREGRGRGRDSGDRF